MSGQRQGRAQAAERLFKRRPEQPRAKLSGRERLRDFLVALLALAMLGGGPLIFFRFWSNPFVDSTCSPSGQRKLAAKKDFVRAHLPGAEQFEVVTYDCDSGASAFLAFTANAAPVEAQDTFLSDPGCQSSPERIDDGLAVVCTAGSKQYTLIFGPGSSGSTTDGELSLR